MVSTLIKTLSCLRDRRLDRALVRYLRIFVAEEDLDLLQERFSVLIERSMTCIRVHDELSIWQMLRQNESVDRCHYDVFVAVNNERRMCDAFQGGVPSGYWYRSPLPDRGNLGDSRVLRHRKVKIIFARLESLQEIVSSSLTGFRGSVERSQQERHGIRLLFRR